MRIGTTAGSFDLLHSGHVLMLEDCKTVCDYLIVLLQTDPTVDRPTKNKPVQTLKERFIVLQSIKYVDEIVVYTTEAELEEWLTKNRDKLSIRILGSDHKNNPNITGKDLNIPVHFHSRDHEWSSSSLRRRVYEAEQKRQNENRIFY